MYDINAAWQLWIGALVYYNKFEIHTVPNDGIVTWTTSQYPGGTRVIQESSLEILHGHQLSSGTVRDHLVDVLTNNFGLTPKPGGDDELYNVTIAGATHILPTSECSWTAFASGGSPPYDYTWYRSGLAVSFSDSYTGGMNAPAQSYFTLQVRAIDAFGRTTYEEILVQSDGLDECLLI